MPKKNLTILFFLLMAMTQTVWFGGAVPKAFATSSERRSKPIPVSLVVPVADMEVGTPRVFTKHPTIGVNYQTTCDDIDPEIGIVIQHDQAGSTWYDYQKNGSMGRMIAVGPGGHRHMAWHYTAGVYPGNPRYVYYNCKDSLGNWLGDTLVDGGTDINAGFTNMGVLHNGREVVIYHKFGSSQPWATTLAFGDVGQLCSSGNQFAKKYDIPDSLGGADDGAWPKMGIVRNAVGDTDYVHIVETEGKTTGGNQKLGYLRCHLIRGDTLLCETPTGQPGVTSPIKVRPNVMLVPNKRVGYFGEVTGIPNEYPNTISVIAVTSPVSQKVAIIFTNKREAGTNQYNNDVFYFEGTNNGNGWFPQYGGTWPPTIANGMLHNITNYATNAKVRAYTDVAACYDHNDSLHITWTAAWYDSATGQTSNDANFYHWSNATGISLIAEGYWGGTDPGAWNRNISKMSIAAMDTSYHPGGNPDSVYLYCIWTQFDSADNSANEYTNGDIYGSGSIDGGASWGRAFNLTNTKTPNCAAGTCLSEHWSSLAQNLYNGSLHIQYICDRDPGGAFQSEGTWTDNPVMYLELQAWNPGQAPLIANFSAEPTSGIAPLEVHFTDLSTGDPISWLWDFGDDSTSLDRNPIHTYNDTGYFDVKLVVSNATETDSVIKYNYIHAYCVGHIAGFVKDTLDLPIYPAQVEVVELSKTTSTGPSGYYKFTNLEARSYTLSTEASGYATVETIGVNVVCEESTQVNFILRPEYFSVSNRGVYNSLIYGLTTGDFNADNNVDIIARGWYDEPGTITRLWGHGDGTFTRQTPIEIFGYVLVGGYFNSDDFLDLALGMYDSLAILLNDGTGNFLPPKCFDLHGSSPLSIATGYLNSDPYLDLVTANMNEQNLSIFQGTGTGDFAFVKNLDLYSYYIDMSDFNKDGKTDLVVGDSGALSVNLGDGNWNFTQSYSTYFGDINSVSTMNSLADFNHDGNLDLIFCIPYYPVPGPSRIGILLGDGEGGFSSVKIIHSPNASTFAAAPADFDGDNNLDFAVTYHDAIKVYFGDGTGNFPRSVLTPIDQVNASASLSLVAADFNKDGNADLAAGRVDPWVSVLLNLNSPKPTIKDEFVLTGYTSVNLNVTDKYGSSANILANAIAGADYFQKDCNQDTALDDRVYNFNAFPGRYRVGVTPRPGSEPGAPSSLGIRINGSVEVFVAIAKEGFQSESNDTIFFIVTDSLPILRLPANTACFCKDTLDTLTFFWNRIEGTSQYHFQLDDTIDFSSPVIDDPAVTDTFFSLTFPLSGKKYYWRVRANGGVWSVFSETFTFFPHLCGDMNGDCKTNVTDVVYLINRLFIGGPDPVCILSADVNNDGQLNVTDVVYLINYLFIGGPPPSC